MIADKWTDYQIIATGDGQKLERWGNIILLRPDPQVIWPAQTDLSKHKGLNAIYKRSDKGGGFWQKLTSLPDEWTIKYGDKSRYGGNILSFLIKPMGFKHTGLFPEQAANWDKMADLITKAKQSGKKDISVLNLFAYTGGASIACAAAGAKVTHIDSAKGMVERAGNNAKLSGVGDKVRLIIDDCKKFVLREIKRGNRYDAILMDPPSYGRGPDGQMWKLEDNLFDLVKLTTQVLSDNPIFFLINSYTTGLQPTVIGNILSLALKHKKGSQSAYELVLPTSEGIFLPCGCSGLWVGE